MKEIWLIICFSWNEKVYFAKDTPKELLANSFIFYAFSSPNLPLLALVKRFVSFSVDNSNISSDKRYLDKSFLEVTPNVS